MKNKKAIAGGIILLLGVLTLVTLLDIMLLII